jgi:hypothetical protein
MLNYKHSMLFSSSWCNICLADQNEHLSGQKNGKATNTVWFQTITPSNIADVITLVKNGQEMWDQSKRMDKEQNGDGERKVGPLFSGRQGEKSAYGKSMQNDKLLHSRAKLDGYLKPQGAIFGTSQWMGEVGTR